MYVNESVQMWLFSKWINGKPVLTTGRGDFYILNPYNVSSIFIKFSIYTYLLGFIDKPVKVLD